MTIAVEGSI